MPQLMSPAPSTSSPCCRCRWIAVQRPEQLIDKSVIWTGTVAVGRPNLVIASSWKQLCPTAPMPAKRTHHASRGATVEITLSGDCCACDVRALVVADLPDCPEARLGKNDEPLSSFPSTRRPCSRLWEKATTSWEEGVTARTAHAPLQISFDSRNHKSAPKQTMHTCVQRACRALPEPQFPLRCRRKACLEKKSKRIHGFPWQAIPTETGITGTGNLRVIRLKPHFSCRGPKK